MATKKEIQIDKLKKSLDKATSLLDKISKLNINKASPVNNFENYLLEIQDICANAINSKKLTIKFLEEKDTELNIEILKLNGYMIKNIETILNDEEKGEFESYVISKKDNFEIKYFTSNYFELLKKEILKEVNIADIYALSCNDIMFNDIELFFVSTMNELEIKSINREELYQLRCFLLNNRDNQINWFAQEKQKREEVLKNYREKYFFIDERGKYGLKEQYIKYNRNYENYKEYELAERYIDVEYWKERNIDRINIINYIDYKDIQWLMYTFEEQRIKELNKICKEIVNLGGKILDIYDVRVGAKGELNFEAECENAIISVKTIGAGGYNIQVFHYRTLVNVKKYKENIASNTDSVKSRLSKVKIDKLNTFIPTIKELVLNHRLTFEEGYVLNYKAYGSYQNIYEWYEWSCCNPMDLDYFLENNNFIKSKTELRKIIKSLCKKKYFKTIKDKFGEEIYLGKETTCIDGLLGFTREDYEDLCKSYNIDIDVFLGEQP